MERADLRAMQDAPRPVAEGVAPAQGQEIVPDHTVARAPAGGHPPKAGLEGGFSQLMKASGEACAFLLKKFTSR
jgi:hypothetical protein